MLVIKQIRSANGASPRQRDTLRSLRLGRIGRESQRGPTAPSCAACSGSWATWWRSRRTAPDASPDPGGDRAPLAAPQAGLAPSSKAGWPWRRIGPRQDLRPWPQGRRRPLGQQAQARLRGRAEPDPHADPEAARPARKMSMPFEQFRTHTQPVNVADLEARFAAGDEVTPETPARRRARQAPPPGEGAGARRADQEAHRPRPRLQRRRQGEDREGRRRESDSCPPARSRHDAKSGEERRSDSCFRRSLNAFKVAEIRKKLAFTAAMLLLYRLGAYIPAPGVDLNTVKEIE